MADLKNQKRLAASVMKVGASRVRIDPDRGEEVASAVTRADVRKLVQQKATGRRTGPGSRKGAANARRPRKESWVMRIRALRDELSVLREKGAIDVAVYRDYYVRAKGGQFRSRAHMKSHMKTEGALSEEVQI